MAPVYQEVTLNWEGKEYTIQPSFRMVQEIESGTISISGVIRKMVLGEPQMSQIAAIVCHMLKSGGVKNLTAEMVYARAAQWKQGEYELIQIAIVMAFIPLEPESDSGNSGGPVDGAETKAETGAETSPT